MTEARDRRRASYQILLATLWLTLLVLAIKVWAGWATRSLSVLAESLHTLIDSFSTLLSLVAVSSPFRGAGREVWAHDKRITALALLLVAFTGFTGFTLIGIALQQLQAAAYSQDMPFLVQVGFPLVHLLSVVVAINVCLMLFERYEARMLESTALRFNANQMLRSIGLTLVVLIGLLGISAGHQWLDAVLAIALVMMSVLNGWQVLNGQLPLLVQQMAIAPEALAQIACQIEGVTLCYQIRSRGIVGRQVFVEMRLVLHPEFIGSAEIIAERLEGAIRERYGLAHTLIHVSSAPEQMKPLSSFRKR